MKRIVALILLLCLISPVLSSCQPSKNTFAPETELAEHYFYSLKFNLPSSWEYEENKRLSFNRTFNIKDYEDNEIYELHISCMLDYGVELEKKGKELAEAMRDAPLGNLHTNMDYSDIFSHGKASYFTYSYRYDGISSDYYGITACMILGDDVFEFELKGETKDGRVRSEFIKNIINSVGFVSEEKGRKKDVNIGLDNIQNEIDGQITANEWPFWILMVSDHGRKSGLSVYIYNSNDNSAEELSQALLPLYSAVKSAVSKEGETFNYIDLTIMNEDGTFYLKVFDEKNVEIRYGGYVDAYKTTLTLEEAVDFVANPTATRNIGNISYRAPILWGEPSIEGEERVHMYTLADRANLAYVRVVYEGGYDKLIEEYSEAEILDAVTDSYSSDKHEWFTFVSKENKLVRRLGNSVLVQARDSQYYLSTFFFMANHKLYGIWVYSLEESSNRNDIALELYKTIQKQ